MDEPTLRTSRLVIAVAVAGLAWERISRSRACL